MGSNCRPFVTGGISEKRKNGEVTYSSMILFESTTVANLRNQIPIQGSVLDGFGEMGGLDIFYNDSLFINIPSGANGFDKNFS